VLFGTDWPITRYDRVFAELDEHLRLEEPVKRKFMHDNAVRAFKLEG
jgi:predicted TIM-barrel fold metal-dependent hydrolase